MKQVKQQISELSPEQFAELQKKNPNLVILDVREKDEQERGIIPNAQLIPRGLLELKVEDAIPDRSQEIVAYCA
ncbi:MAG TPA: molybdopterin biosynthesis protein MoeB, partial [Deltaproteobacteria bacterium]|nr:molybdopterin biosynthesis protein MoeB [Deltaproteobacteria bacterium]